MSFTPTLAGQRLTAGALNDLLLIGATVFSTSTNAGQSIATRATEVVGDAVVWDPPGVDLYGAWSSGAPTRFACPKPGLWTLAGGLGYNASAGGTLREAIWYGNGALLFSGRSAPVVSSAIAATALTTAARTLTLPLLLGDYIELVPLQNSGGALTLASGSLRPFMTATYAGPGT